MTDDPGRDDRAAVGAFEGGLPLAATPVAPGGAENPATGPATPPT